MTSVKGNKKDKNQNIQVFVRLRPLNQRERDIKSLGVVEVVNNKEVVVCPSQQTSHTKRFTFDSAFGPHAKQVEVYQQVVSPLIEEVLAGYNCTVFAYGQTGTGKTHTMVGESTSDETDWQNDPLAGIIPRALSQLFDELRLSNTEYTVRVSYLELYNEELFDLLSTTDDNSKLRIYEDVSRKGSNIVNGLEEITVFNKNEVYKIMSQGQERKRVASTLMNAQSSRSHTVFTIVVHMKENSPEGEELVKIGKLNLVDLAGSENISKAGSDYPAKRERARECVTINQSLLTLGRVITALVERHPHIPYRESKLTRILQESLGGRTKTSIIATVSPGHKDLEETLSTLEYAHRAKNIQNKPEVNKKLSKKVMLKEYAEEIDRLKRDLQAARDKSGVYLANETFAEMTLKQEEQRKEVQELLLRKRALEEERDRIESMFSDTQQKLQQRESELNNTMDKLKNTKMQLTNTFNILQTTRTQFAEQKQLLEFQKKIERELSAQAQQILAAADQATAHLQHLHDAFDKRKSVEARNAEVTRQFRSECAQRRERVAEAASECAQLVRVTLRHALDALESHTADNIHIYEDSRKKLEDVVKHAIEAMNLMRETDEKITCDISSNALKQQEHIRTTLDTQRDHLHNALEKSAENSVGVLHSVGELDLPKAVAACLEEWRRAGEEGVGRARSVGGRALGGARELGVRAGGALRLHGAARAQHATQLDAAVAETTQLILRDKEYIEKKLLEQIVQIDKEKAESEARLAEWAEEERKLLEERISRHVQREQMALEERLRSRRLDIEEQRGQLEERIGRDMECLNAILRLNEKETEKAQSDLKQSEDEIKAHLTIIDKLSQECDEEMTSVLASIESLNVNVLNIAEQVKGQMIDALYKAAEKVKMETNSMTSSNKEVTDQLSATLVSSTSAMAQNCIQALNGMHRTATLTITTTMERTSSLNSNNSMLQSASESHLRAQSEKINSTQEEIEQFHSNLREELNSQEELEEKYLKEEFKVYSPTGRTPLRRVYRYPRRLPAPPATPDSPALPSPRQPLHEVLLVESDDETGQTSPPPPPPPPPPVLKSISETDMYARQRQERLGQENVDVNRSLSLRKPSKLPAPSHGKSSAAAGDSSRH